MIPALVARSLVAPAWCICLACLLPAVGRLLLHRGRRLDPIWGVVFLLAVNRLSYHFHVSAVFSNGSAAALALAMAAISVGYQRHDA